MSGEEKTRQDAQSEEQQLHEDDLEAASGGAIDCIPLPIPFPFPTIPIITPLPGEGGLIDR